MNGLHSDLNKLPMLQYLSESCKLLMLNLYEIVTWYSFLKKLKFNITSVPNLLNCTAYLTKELLVPDQEMVVFRKYFESYEKEFLDNYLTWKLGPGSTF